MGGLSSLCLCLFFYKSTSGHHTPDTLILKKPSPFPLSSCVDAPHGDGSLCLPAFRQKHHRGTGHCSLLPKCILTSRNSSMNPSLSSFLYDPHRKNSPHVLFRSSKNVVVMQTVIIIMTAII